MIFRRGKFRFERAAVIQLAALLYATTGIAVPAAAEEVPGWFIGHMNEKSCIAIGAKTDEASFGLTSEGPQLWLFIASESFKVAKGESHIGIKVDDSAEIQVNVIGEDVAYRTIVNRQLYESIKIASNLDLPKRRFPCANYRARFRI
jgi:hypothetical protein